MSTLKLLIALVELLYLQGDSLVLECVYQTVNLSTTLFVSWTSTDTCSMLGNNLIMGTPDPMQGGLATTDEMCLSFLLYYPRSEVAICLSDPDVTQAYDSFFSRLK